MSNTKHEDAIMKMGFRYFHDQILKTLGIDYTYIDVGPTELVEFTMLKTNQIVVAMCTEFFLSI